MKAGSDAVASSIELCSRPQHRKKLVVSFTLWPFNHRKIESAGMGDKATSCTSGM
jgi:hypothetical protein